MHRCRQHESIGQTTQKQSHETYLVGSNVVLGRNNQHPDADTWLQSYKEEYNGLVDHNTSDVISEQEYHAIHDQTGCSAIPSMNIFTIKPDSDGNPKRAKSRIVVLGNKDPVDWMTADCYVPVVSQPIVSESDIY
jgi:hypothetical protein